MFDIHQVFGMTSQKAHYLTAETEHVIYENISVQKHHTHEPYKCAGALIVRPSNLQINYTEKIQHFVKLTISSSHHFKQRIQALYGG